MTEPRARVPARVQRLDFSAFRADDLTTAPGGALRAPAYPTRVGVFEYSNPDGTVRRELRTPEEVFAPDSLSSMRGAALTLFHPAAGVSPHNYSTEAIGHVGDTVAPEGDLVRTDVIVAAASALEGLAEGVLGELSCGYACDLLTERGVWRGLPYDAIQQNIRYNHVALGLNKDWGRAGPLARIVSDASLTLDSLVGVGDNRPVGRALSPGREDQVVPRMTLEQALAALAKAQEELGAAKARADKASADLVAATARADKADAERDVAKEAAAAALVAAAPAVIDARVDARIALVESARAVLGDEKLSGKSDHDVRVAVLTKLSPAFKADGKSAEYISARFDAALEAREAAGETAVAETVRSVAVKADTVDLAAAVAAQRANFDSLYKRGAAAGAK